MQTDAAEDFASLYAQIESANSRSGNTTITLTEDITLSAALPPITGEIVIEGGGHTIGGDGQYRIFDVNGGRLTIKHLTLTEGKAPDEEDGGAIRLRNGAQVAIENSTFSDNEAFRGGAIATTSDDVRLTVKTSSFLRNNSGNYGGAIFANASRVDVARSSFQKNQAGYGGGAISTYGGRISASNSTFEGNSARVGGALEVFDAEATFTHVTIMVSVSFNRGYAIHRSGGVIKLRNSIVGGQGHNSSCTNGLTEARGNLSQDGSCALLEARLDPLLGELTGSPAWYPLLDGSPALDAADPEFCLETDQIGTARPQGGGCDIGAIESTTAKLAPTPIVPPPGCSLSDRITAANTDAPAGACLAGSGHDTITLHEDVKLGMSLPPITSEITVEGNGHTISGNRRHRIFDVAGGSLTLKNATLTNGRGVDGGAIRLRENARVTVEQVTFNSNSATNGGAIATMYDSSIATINSSSFVRNKSDEYGGAIQAMRGTVTVTNSSFERNEADFFGGALNSQYGSFVVNNSTFIKNSAVGGGVLHVDFGKVTLTHLTMVDNYATQLNGDAIYKYEGSVYLRNSIIYNDRVADDCDGGLTQSSGNLNPDGSCGVKASDLPLLDKLTGSPAYYPLLEGSPAVDVADPQYCLETDQIDRARPYGGGCDIGAIESATASPALATPVPVVCTLYDQIVAANSDRPAGQCPAGNGADTITLSHDVTLSSRLPEITSGLTIEGNGHTISGDGRLPIFSVKGVMLEINNLTMANGSNPRDSGGAINLQDGSSAVVNNSSFLNNAALSGGAIGMVGSINKVTVINSSFTGNVAERGGGAIAMWSGPLIIRGSSFVSNQASMGGAIEAASGKELSIANSTFSGNEASSWGGVLAVNYPKVTMTHVTMLNNKVTGYHSYANGNALWIHQNNSGFYLRNSIVDGDGRTVDCYGQLTQNIGNLIEDGSCSPKLSGDPMLDELTGSPAWHPLQAGSPALDAADERFCLATDQTGKPRPQVGACDIGAIEATAVIEPLSGCSVTTTHGLNLRDGPARSRIGSIPEGATLTAMARTPGWLNVEYDGTLGWISADYVVAEGDCG